MMALPDLIDITILFVIIMYALFTGVVTGHGGGCRELRHCAGALFGTKEDHLAGGFSPPWLIR